MARPQRWLEIYCLLACLASLPGCDAHHYFYRPTQEQYANPANQGLRYEDIFFTSLDGTRLHGWFIPAKGQAQGTLIHFHGNSKNISGHLHYTDWLAEKGFNLFLFDYRGYGKSAGTPEPEGLTQDGVAAIRYIQSRKDIDHNRLLVFGQSLGGTYSLTALARERRGVCGVVIEGTFSSHREIAIDQMASDDVPRPLKSFIATLLVGNQHDAAPLIGQFGKLPILLVHGSADSVIPVAHGDRLAALLPKDATYWRKEGDHHLVTFMADRTENRASLQQFLEHSLKNCPKK
ncbi:MAG: hydrolase or acyltransferase, alpha/beta fold family [Proteobacteria bacterium]|nr:hydrolase or acyltransferase, alpha/beta fold family [Pseudomonadota bacterium]